jgi:hypothetical protein
MGISTFIGTLENIFNFVDKYDSLISLLLSLLSIIISVIIAYHILYLSKKFSLEINLKKRDEMRIKLEKHIHKIKNNGGRHRVYLVNTDTYYQKYPHNDDYAKAEIKTTKFNGVEFFITMPELVTRKASGKLYFVDKESDETFLVNAVGFIPYEEIEYIDYHSDEYLTSPLFFIKYKTNFVLRNFRFEHYPFLSKNIFYYKRFEKFDKNRDPYDTEYRLIEEKIYRK